MTKSFFMNYNLFIAHCDGYCITCMVYIISVLYIVEVIQDMNLEKSKNIIIQIRN